LRFLIVKALQSQNAAIEMYQMFDMLEYV